MLVMFTAIGAVLDALAGTGADVAAGRLYEGRTSGAHRRFGPDAEPVTDWRGVEPFLVAVGMAPP